MYTDGSGGSFYRPPSSQTSFGTHNLAFNAAGGSSSSPHLYHRSSPSIRTNSEFEFSKNYDPDNDDQLYDEYAQRQQQQQQQRYQPQQQQSYQQQQWDREQERDELVQQQQSPMQQTRARDQYDNDSYTYADTYEDTYYAASNNPDVIRRTSEMLRDLAGGSSQVPVSSQNYIEEYGDESQYWEDQEPGEDSFVNFSLLSHLAVQLRDKVPRGTHVKGSIPYQNAFTGKDIVVSFHAYLVFAIIGFFPLPPSTLGSFLLCCHHSFHFASSRHQIVKECWFLDQPVLFTSFSRCQSGPDAEHLNSLQSNLRSNASWLSFMAFPRMIVGRRCRLRVPCKHSSFSMKLNGEGGCWKMELRMCTCFWMIRMEAGA